jgi:DnaJ family protein C protein 3
VRSAPHPSLTVNTDAQESCFTIEQSPADYLLYYKRATAYLSLSRHPNALDDFDRVLSLTSNSFDNAMLMKAKIHTKDGRWTEARQALDGYSAKVKNDASAVDLLASITEGETAAKKVVQAQNAQLWTACTEAASQALKTASHSLEIRQQRAECALAAGDFEGAVGDLTLVIRELV